MTLRTLPWLVLPLLFMGCSTQPSQTDYVTQADADRQSIPDWGSLSDQSIEPTFLNDLMSSDVLDTLVAQALQGNPGLQQTLLTLKIQLARLEQNLGDRHPEVSAGLSASRSEDSDASYTGSVKVSWEADFWGKLAHEQRALSQEAEGQTALFEQARAALVAEVMQTWLEAIAAKRTIDIESRRLDLLQKNETLIQQRYRSGLGSRSDLDSAKSSVSSAQSGLEADKEDLVEIQRQLKRLLGQSEQLQVDIPDGYPEVMLPLTSLPDQTLAERPDLKAAYLDIAAAENRISVAYKALLPSISFQAALQDVAESPQEALLSGPVWSLLGQLTLPLYQGGRLRKEIEVAELKTAYAYQVYRETLLTAVGEVEQAIGQEKLLARQQGYIEKALAASRQSVEQYQQSYRTGLTDILTLLKVQQQSFDLESQLDQLIYQRLSNRIDLGLALGLRVPS